MDLGLEEVRERVAAATSRSARDPGAVTLVAVSKGRPDDAVRVAYTLGQRVFGENRQQGLAARMEAGLPDDIEWHFIGPLQRRKVRSVTEHASMVHSFDRLELLTRWPDRGPQALLQFNVGDEPQKGGFAVDQAPRLADEVIGAGVEVAGVMAIPPMVDDPEQARPYFVTLRRVFDALRGDHPSMTVCSMGMSNDYEVAIEEGSTMVRVGTAIFGPVER